MLRNLHLAGPLLIYQIVREAHLYFVAELSTPITGYEQDIPAKLNIISLTVFAGSHTEIFKVDKKS